MRSFVSILNQIVGLTFLPIFLLNINITGHRYQAPATLGISAEIKHEPADLLDYIDKNNPVSSPPPNDLIDLSNLGYPNQKIHRVAYQDLQDLVENAKENRLNLKIISAYRNKPTQQTLFSGYTSKYGLDTANSFSAIPGFSEHHLGTAIDFGSGRYTDLTKGFAQEPEGQWLNENAANFGFILSYPDSKEQVTGYIYEPWHYRYVGKTNAHKIKRLNMTLKEYSKYQSNTLLLILRKYQEYFR